MKPDIIHYLDYRSYLKDLIAWLREENHSLSMRKISSIAGVSSPNWVQQVVSGRIKAKPEAIERLAQYAGLSKRDKERFVQLLSFDKASTLNEKDEILRKILQDRRKMSAYTLENYQYQYFSSWYIPVVRELCTNPGFDGTEEWIAKRTQPSIRKSNVRRALRILAKLKLIKKDSSTGKWLVTTNSVVTPSEVASLAVKRYHEKISELGRSAISTFEREERDIRSITLGLSKKKYTELKRKLEDFWYELMEFASTDNETERVFQYTMHLFPISSELKNCDPDIIEDQNDSIE